MRLTAGNFSRKSVLPNIKLHKKSRSPENYKKLGPESYKILLNKLTSPEQFSPYQSTDYKFRPGSIDLSSANEKIVDQTFSARFAVGEPIPVRKISPEVPTLKYSNVIMSKDLAVMAQVRKSLIGEVSSNKIQHLTVDNLPQFRNSFYPKEMQNIGDSLQLVQKSKANSERKARHPYGTGAYDIKALRPRAQKLIIEKLRVSLPEGSRFIQYL